MRGSSLSVEDRECGLDFTCEHTRPHSNKKLVHPEHELRRIAVAEHPSPDQMPELTPGHSQFISTARLKPISPSADARGYMLKRCLCTVVVLFMAMLFILAMASLACVTTHTQCWIDEHRAGGSYNTYLQKMERVVAEREANVKRMEARVAIQKHELILKAAALEREARAAGLEKDSIVGAAEAIEREKASMVSEREALGHEKGEIGREAKWFESKLRQLSANHSKIGQFTQSVQEDERKVTEQGYVTRHKARKVDSALQAMKKATGVLGEATTDAQLEQQAVI